MTSITLRAAVLVAMVTVGVTAGGAAQTVAADPHHPDKTLAQAAPSAGPGDTAAQNKGAQPGQSGMMPPGMMGQGMMGGMPMMSMRGHMRKVMFAIADVDGDGALSFEEVTAIHKRIFNKVDANKDGKVTLEEIQAFMRE